jgi:pilus assembly protein Flp/PilA
VLRKFLRDPSGATAIEYCLIAAGIALAIIAAVGLTGDKLVQLFSSLVTAFG